MQSDVIVTVCTRNELRTARELLLSDSAEPDRSSSIPDSVSADLDPQRILVAIAQGRLEGAVYHQLGRGNVGWMWAPALAEAVQSGSSAEQMIRALVTHAIDRLAKQGARLIQILLHPTDRCGADLTGCGFRHITEIVQMDRAIAASSDIESTLNIEFVPFSESLSDDFCRVVEQTYTNSLDCPELDGVRRVADVLEGYRAAGEFRNELWWLVRSKGEFVGCVLLCFFPESAVATLQYMGVVPARRRLGTGRQMARHALRVAASAGAQLINLAVDVRNDPAWRLYREIGFQETGRRSVFIMQVGLGSSSHELSTMRASN